MATDTTTGKTEPTELEKLEALIQAEKAAAEATRTATAESTALDRKRLELDAAKRESEAQLVIARFTKELGPKGIKWDALDSEGGIIVFARPTRPRFDEWIKQESQTDPGVMMSFVSTCVKHPSLQAFDAIITAQPAKLLTSTAICNRLGGANAKEIEGKS
jgi:hypothetical protein